LHDRVGGEEKPDGPRRGIKPCAFSVKRKDRNNDAEAKQINKDGREDDDERGALHELNNGNW
jgi:hypothetical protein